MEDNTQQITQKDIFDLSYKDFSDIFYKDLEPQFVSLKENLSNKHSHNKFIGIFLILFLIVWGYAIFPSGEWKKGDGIWVTFAFFIFAFICIEYLKKAFSKGGFVMYEAKEKFFPYFGIKYLRYMFGSSSSQEAEEIKKWRNSAPMEYRKNFISQVFKRLFSPSTEGIICYLDESLEMSYKGLPFEILEFHCSIKMTGFSHFLLISTKINKNFNGETIANSKKSFFGGASGKQEVFFEDPEFSNIFKVVADDQVEARYLLTTSFINRLINYKNGHNCSIDILFSRQVSSQVNTFICISSNKDFFEISAKSNWERNPSLFYNILEEIKEIAEIVDALKLDQDIGM